LLSLSGWQSPQDWPKAATGAEAQTNKTEAVIARNKDFCGFITEN